MTSGTIEAGKCSRLRGLECDEQPAELVYRIGFNPLHMRHFPRTKDYSMTIILHPGSVSLSTLETIYWQGAPVRLDPSYHAGIESSAARRIAEIAAGNAPVYGINTGFGKAGFDQDRCCRCWNAATQSHSFALLRCRQCLAGKYRPPDHGSEADIVGPWRFRGAFRADHAH